MPTHNTHNNPLPIIGNNFVELIAVDSTNTYAMQQIQAKVAEHGTAYFAHTQLQGKGTKGKTWYSEKASNTVLSVVLNVEKLPIHKQFYLSAAVALSVYDFLLKYIQNGIKIKWPNDIYYNNSKIAGILIENNIKGTQMQWAVAGIGININQTNFHNTLNNATSLALITKKLYSVIELTKELCAYLEKRYQQLLYEDYDTLLKEYNEHLFKKNELVKLKKNNMLFNCTVKKVTDLGFLVVENGVEQQFSFGEVEWVL